MKKHKEKTAEKGRERPPHTEGLAGGEKLPKKGESKKGELPKEMVLSYQEYKAVKEKSDLADEYFDKLLRMQAESENLKKRLIKEKIEFVRYANEELMAQLIGIIDDFERAVESTKKGEDFKVLSQGVGMITKDLRELLEGKGLVEINEVGVKFDPAKHEAIEQVIAEQHPEDTVVEVLRKGYALNDRIIRPAAVKVSRKSEDREQRTEDFRENG